MHLFSQYLFELLALVWLVSASRDILFWLHFIQVKQYRPDRLIAALRLIQTWRLIASPVRLTGFLLLLAWEILLRFFPSARAVDAMLWIILLYFLFQAMLGAVRMAQGRLQIPKLTKKIIVLFSAILGMETLLLIWYAFWPEQVLAITVVQPFIVGAVFFISQLPNRLLRRRLLRKAAYYRKLLPSLVVIGITGSYGKTTTKEYLAHILAAHGRVAKTPAHINVDTGVAQTLLDEVDASHRYFIVEMGAYRRGEIADICRVVKPDYGVITAISNQHLELFGSQEKLIDTKFELCDAVSDQAHLIANADSPLLVDACKRRHVNPIWFGREGETRLKATEIHLSASGTTFKVSGIPVTVPIVSTAGLSNLLAAMTMAHVLGMELQTIVKAAAAIPVIDHTMQKRVGAAGAMLIDSTYNASTDGVIQAIKDLSSFEKKYRAVVFKDIIELGDDATQDHQRIAEILAQRANAVLLLNSPRRSFLKQALIGAGLSADAIYDEDGMDAFLKHADADWVILFAGRDSARVLEKCL